jgi:CDP-diacylglycerol--serine O-phosphatidyltransferase
VKRVNPLPTLLTLCNLICGFGAITASLRAGHFIAKLEIARGLAGLGADRLMTSIWQQHAWAVGFIFAAMVFDVLDGRIARMAGLTSRFGAELDSLSDVVSFGVAPAVLAKTVLDLGGWPLNVSRFFWVMLALYAASAAVRLARYNVEAISPSDGSVGKKGKDYFVGLPSPAAAGMAVSPVLFYHWLVEKGDGLGIDPRYASWLTLVLPALLLLLAWLMVSRVRYMHLGNRLFSGRKRLWPVLLILVVLSFMVAVPQVAGTVLFGTYVIGFLIWDVGRRARSARARRKLPRQNGGGAPAPAVETAPASGDAGGSEDSAEAES